MPGHTKKKKVQTTGVAKYVKEEADRRREASVRESGRR